MTTLNHYVQVKRWGFLISTNLRKLRYGSIRNDRHLFERVEGRNGDSIEFR